MFTNFHTNRKVKRAEKVIIWRASIFETDLVNYDYLEDPIGTILEVFLNDKFLIKCRGGILLVHEFNSNIKISKGKKIIFTK